MERLRKSFEAQRRFISDAAHELRMPLAALQLELHNLQQTVSSPPETQALVRLEARVHRASRLVAQLLSLARLERGDARPKCESVDLSALLKECLSEVLPLADTKQIDLGMRVDAPVHVNGERDALRVLFGNLLDNAIRYSPEHGVVDVGVLRRGDTVLVEVTDNGPGIPPALSERVFERFFRIGAGESVGSGLGLAIARTIADQHKARIRLVNRMGGGTRAEVAFPGA